MFFQTQFTVTSTGRSLLNITKQVQDCVSKSQVTIGLCHIFLHHTSASLIFCENADQQVLEDLQVFMRRLVPDGDPIFKHTDEGIDDMPAHVRTVLTQSFLSIPITNNQLALGTWQGVYLWEHRLL